MSEINKNSILLNYQGPLQQAETNPNSVVIAGGTASIPTGRPTTVESSQRAAPQYDGIGVDFTRTPETMWPTGPGIQIVTGDQETDDASDCRCECCCCEEPESPHMFFKPADECDVCQASKDLTVGVFIDGQSATSTDKEWEDHKKLSGIRRLCAKYGHEKWLYVAYFGPHETMGLAGDIAQKLKEEICKRSWWDKEGGTWRSCHRVNIDLFGFSRGAATAVKVADLLNEKWECVKCPDAPPRGPAHVRFLGIIDPYPEIIPGLIDIPGTNVLPGNVQYFYSAYSSKDRGSTQVASRWKSEHFSETERKVDAGNMFPLEHGKMDSFEEGPIAGMESAYLSMTGESLHVSTREGCTVLNPDADKVK